MIYLTLLVAMVATGLLVSKMAKVPIKSIKQTIEELNQRVAQLEIEKKYMPDPFFRQWVEISKIQPQHVDANKDLEIRWECLWAFVGEAIRHEKIVSDLVQRHNQSVLLYEAMKKDKAELAAQISSLNDLLDSTIFEHKQVRKDRDDAVGRSQRQAARITELEAQVERLKTEWNGTVEMANKLEAIKAILRDSI